MRCNQKSSECVALSERESASSPSHGAGSRLARGAEKQITKPQNEIPGQADTDRAEAFSDGVLAIVITLLVLELKPPQANRDTCFPACSRNGP